MIDVHVGRVAVRGRTLANPELDRLLARAKGNWLMAAKGMRSTLALRVQNGPWPTSLAQKLQYWVTEMSEAEARIDELIRVDTVLTSWRDSGVSEKGTS